MRIRGIFAASSCVALLLTGCEKSTLTDADLESAEQEVNPVQSLESLDQLEGLRAIGGLAVLEGLNELDETELAGKKTGTAVTIGNCEFIDYGNLRILQDDCTTDATIVIPDGYVLVGKRHTITAVDPTGGHFLGAVIKNGGASAHVTLLNVTASGLSNVCDGSGVPDNRLRGIMFDGASGSITLSNVTGINQGPSGCQEGNAIEVRNAPFDGTHPATVQVAVGLNTVDAYQKTGIVANGDVQVWIEHNKIGGSATQHNLAANSIQLGFGGIGAIRHNRIDGNQWFGASDFAATAILLYDVEGADVSKNDIDGNSDIGIYAIADASSIEKNKLTDEGLDSGHYDVGIGNYGADNTVSKNKIKGFDVPYEDLGGGKSSGGAAVQPFDF